MNRTHPLRLSRQIGPVRMPRDPLDEVTGLVWSSVLGGAFWVMVIALALSH
ncbi:MAG: hypothetical protein ABL931_07330 [Usitatibacteraceae bacterium]